MEQISLLTQCPIDWNLLGIVFTMGAVFGMVLAGFIVSLPASEIDRPFDPDELNLN